MLYVHVRDDTKTQDQNEQLVVVNLFTACASQLGDVCRVENIACRLQDNNTWKNAFVEYSG